MDFEISINEVFYMEKCFNIDQFTVWFVFIVDKNRYGINC